MKIRICILLSFLIFYCVKTFSQCTPDNCLSLLPPYGGICDSSIIDGRVNEPYYDYISFHITNSCVDLGSLDPQYTGIGAKMLKLHTFSFTGLPNGITGQTSQTQYNAPANGCGAFSGTPTEVGEFDAVIHILANIRTWPLSTTCNGLFPIDQNNQEFDGTLNFKILPNPDFTGLDSFYCSNHAPVTLIPTGTQGGIFSGNGVNGNIFDPSAAGIGIHEIKYVVSAQEGAAVAPASDSSSFFVTVLDEHTFSENHEICQNNPFFWRGQYYSVAGTYFDSLLTTHGCDSIYILNLNVNSVNTDVIQNQNTLTASATNAIFQWVDCNNSFSAIFDETSNIFSPESVGSYAVIITQNNCTDTSECFTISNASLNDIYSNNKIFIYPNPNNGIFTLILNAQKEIILFDAIGKTFYKKTHAEGKHLLNFMHLDKGMYFMQIKDNKNNELILFKVVLLNY